MIRVWMVIFKKGKSRSEVHVECADSVTGHDCDGKCIVRHVKCAMAISKTRRETTVTPEKNRRG